MSGSTIGRRYARALLELAEEQKKTAKIQKDLEGFLAVWNESQELREVFENPAVGAEQRKAVLDELAKKMMLAPMLANALRLLSDRRRFRHVPEVAEAFLALAQAAQGSVVAEVTTAAQLPEAYYTRLRQTLEKAFDKKVTIVKKEDPQLIAGVVTRIGDKVFDGSVRTRLEEMKETMLA